MQFKLFTVNMLDDADRKNGLSVKERRKEETAFEKCINDWLEKNDVIKVYQMIAVGDKMEPPIIGIVYTAPRTTS